MVYHKFVFEHQIEQDVLDIIISELGDLGFESFEQEQTELNAYLPGTIIKDSGKEIFIIKIKKILEDYHGVTLLRSEDIPDINWNKEWESNYEPVQIGSFCLVKAPFHDMVAEVKHTVIIEPKMSFGTAHHPTTSLMIEYISNIVFVGKTVIDMGCGTGILAILAHKEGAKNVLAVDFDEWAYNNTVENVEKNAASAISVYRGGKEILIGKYADVILANINRNVLLDQIPVYAEILGDDGILVLSGFYTADISAISIRCEEEGLFLMDGREKESWAALRFKKKADKREELL